MYDTVGAVLDDMEQARAEKRFVDTDAAVYNITNAVLELFLCEKSRIVRQACIGFDEHIAGRVERVTAEGSIVCCLLHLMHGLMQCNFA